MRRMRKKLLWIAPLGILGMALFVALGGTLVKLLWNALLPPLFGWHEVGFWQALGLLVLCRILFGGVRLHGGGPSLGRRWAARWGDRWAAMTPEERERFRQGLRGHGGFDPPMEDAKGQ